MIAKRVNHAEELGTLKPQARCRQNPYVFEERHVDASEDQRQFDHRELEVHKEYDKMAATIRRVQIKFGIINDAMSQLVTPGEEGLELLLNLTTNAPPSFKAVNELPKCNSAGFLLDVL